MQIISPIPKKTKLIKNISFFVEVIFVVLVFFMVVFVVAVLVFSKFGDIITDSKF